jgi:predicted nucleic acid-binding protein
MSAAVIDASVWVSRLAPVDVHHRASRQWLETHAASGDQFVCPTLVLAEIAGAVARRTGDAHTANEAVAAIERIPALRLLSLDPRLAKTAARLAADYALRGADAVYVAVASELSLPLITFDDEQLTRAKSLITTMMPSP